MINLPVALVAAASLSFGVAPMGEPAPEVAAATAGGTIQPVGFDPVTAEPLMVSPCAPRAPKGVTPAPTTLEGRRVLVGYNKEGMPEYYSLPDNVFVTECDAWGAPNFFEIIVDDGPCKYLGKLCELLG